MIIECACGAVIRGSSEHELLGAARLHMHTEHSKLGEPPSAADLLAMASDEPIGNSNAHAPILSQIDAEEQSQCGT